MPSKIMKWDDKEELALLIRVIDQAGNIKVDAQKIIDTWPDTLSGPPNARSITDRLRTIRQRDLGAKRGNNTSISTSTSNKTHTKQPTSSSKKRKLNEDTDGANDVDAEDDYATKKETVEPETIDSDDEDEEVASKSTRRAKGTPFLNKCKASSTKSTSTAKGKRARSVTAALVSDDEGSMSSHSEDSDDEDLGFSDPFNSKNPGQSTSSRRNAPRRARSSSPIVVGNDDSSSGEGVTGGMDGADSDEDFDPSAGKAVSTGRVVKKRECEFQNNVPAWEMDADAEED